MFWAERGEVGMDSTNLVWERYLMKQDFNWLTDVLDDLCKSAEKTGLNETAQALNLAIATLTIELKARKIQRRDTKSGKESRYCDC